MLVDYTCVFLEYLRFFSTAQVARYLWQIKICLLHFYTF